MKEVLTLVLVGLSVGLGNFAASIAIGIDGISKAIRIRVILVFGLFETLMPIIGLIIGKNISHYLGGSANLIGGILLGLTGFYLIISSLNRNKSNKNNKLSTDWTSLLITGLALSIDNLIVGFSLGTNNQPLLLAIIIIGTTSIVLALIGLELGNKLKSKTEEYSEILSGAILILVGILIIFKVL